MASVRSLQSQLLWNFPAIIRDFHYRVMSREQMTAIGSPVEGLMVYCSDCISQSQGSVYFFDGSSWIGFFSDYYFILKKENLSTKAENLRILMENLVIEAMAEEACKLQAELKQLEQGGGG